MKKICAFIGNKTLEDREKYWANLRMRLMSMITFDGVKAFCFFEDGDLARLCYDILVDLKNTLYSKFYICRFLQNGESADTDKFDFVLTFNKRDADMTIYSFIDFFDYIVFDVDFNNFEVEALLYAKKKRKAVLLSRLGESA